MRTRIVLIICILLLNCCTSNRKEEVNNNLPVEGSISVFCTPDLFNLTTKWVSEFCRINPNVNIKVIEESSIVKVLHRDRNLAFVSDEYESALYNESIWKIVIGRDVIVPIINSKNPFLDEIYQQGISSEKFAQIFQDHKMQKWGTLLKIEQNVPVNYYMIHDESINSGVANFLNLNQISINGTEVENTNELISSIQNDAYAIGFCKMVNILDISNQRIVENIKLLPIDRNGNGEIDYMEKIYDNLNLLSRGVWIGKYPKALFSNIYSVSPKKPKNEIEMVFLKWVLTDGQQFLNPIGYSDLVLSERQAKIDMLYNHNIDIGTSTDNYAISKGIILLILGSFVAAIYIVLVVVRYIKHKNEVVPIATSDFPNVFDEDSVRIPKGLYYDKTHTWAFMEKDGTVKVGIDDFLQRTTGRLTRTKMKNIGDRIKKGSPVLAIIQDGKQLNIYSPVSGTIIAQNNILNTNSEKINSSPYDEGWVYRIEPTNWLREIQFLIMEKKYKEWLKSEFPRLKEFLIGTVKPDSDDYALCVLQDGGQLKDGILVDLGPEIWEDFQTNFIDTFR